MTSILVKDSWGHLVTESEFLFLRMLSFTMKRFADVFSSFLKTKHTKKQLKLQGILRSLLGSGQNQREMNGSVSQKKKKKKVYSREIR